jgi:hypothetical protein
LPFAEDPHSLKLSPQSLPQPLKSQVQNINLKLKGEEHNVQAKKGRKKTNC